jgi:RNA polymerase sigma factor (sigma-70 family)
MTAAVEAAVADAHRREWGFVLAATLRVAGDIDLAEECVQDAYARALASWPQSGIPRSTGAWLTTVARRRALDLLRRRTTHDRTLPLLAAPVATDTSSVEVEAEGPEEAQAEPEEIADERLRLIFTCCHPALTPEAQVALTLRLVCGLSTAEVARAFLVSEPTMAARITRAKKKIRKARIPYRVPAVDELPARVDAALSVVHLVFTTGHTAPVGQDLLRPDLVERALDLAHIMRTLLPGDGEVTGLLALIVLTDVRRRTRVDEAGRPVLLSDQDRSRWDRSDIDEGIGLMREALSLARPGRYTLMAAISAVHAASPSWEATDWVEIVRLYDRLLEVWPTPVVALNRAVAVGFGEGPQAGLALLDTLATEPLLAGYPYLASSRAQFLHRLGRLEDAAEAYREASMLTENDAERRFLTDRARSLQP